MNRTLLISVRFHDGRYHGAYDWPPASARLFQALVAAAPKTGDGLEQASRDALAWLEQQSAPVIAAPPKHEGQHVSLFVPNNDLDAKGGDTRRIAEVRSATKHVRPRIFDASVPLLYVWRFDGDDTHAKCICRIADGLYQLGRGVDMAWATAEVLNDESAVEARLAEYPAVIHRPPEGGSSSDGTALACPEPGSLESLIDRYKANAQRFRPVRDGKGKIIRTEFANAPKPRFRSVAYNIPATRLLFDIRRTTESGAPFAPWPLKQAAVLVQKLRDGAVAKLSQKNLSKHFDAGTINKVLIGRDATEADKALRVRIVPLPSIGHAQVNRSIRRVLVDVPPDCPIRADDVAWAFAGLPISGVDLETGEIESSIVELVRADDESMLAHYGVGGEGISSRVWRSVTPLALPTPRRHIDPAKLKEEAKNGTERQVENRRAIHEVAQALRHAGLRQRITHIRVQREPFEAKGERADAFADGTRFSKHHLWHVEIDFSAPVNRLTVLGSGRYMGLGLMAPVRQTEGFYSFAIVDGLTAEVDPVELARALRRAVMARVQVHIGKGEKLPVFFTGHEADGKPSRGGNHAHLAFVPDIMDKERKRVLIIAPHVIEHREPSQDEQEYLTTLVQALARMDSLRAGRSGLLRLVPQAVNREADPLFTPSTRWIATTKYLPTRHAKKNGADFLQSDVLRETQRRNLPVPQQVGINDNVTLQFAVAVPGPVLLGKNLHLGGGLFRAHP